MRIAYFDCFAGASGNMILGSLVDAGLSLETLQRELERLPVSGWSLQTERVRKRGLAALYLDVVVPGEDGHSHGEHKHEGVAHRRLDDVLKILRAAKFRRAVEAAAEKVYRALAQAEARIHGSSAEDVVFHEVGQVDAIIDIAGAALALDLLNVEAVYASAMPCGTGNVESAHGTMPSPAPATLELLRGVPTYQRDLAAEFVTPTGAAILTSLASFEARPAMMIEKIGYGSGRSDFPFPNVLRVLIGETSDAASVDRVALVNPASDAIMQLEANIDDMNPQLYEFVMERLFASGALDVWMTPVIMKKGRPAIVLSALATPELADAVAAVILAETSSIGLRRWPAQRDVLLRRVEVVETTHGAVHVKVVESPGGVSARPEYDDCRKIAQKRQIALVAVMRDVERDVADWLRKREQI